MASVKPATLTLSNKTKKKTKAKKNPSRLSFSFKETTKKNDSFSKQKTLPLT